MTETPELERAIAKLNGRAWGFASGLLCGTGLMVATLFLVIKGGPTPGQHLSLLSIYFPGYAVTIFGALIGFVYAFVAGYAIGRVVGTLYNRLT